MITPACCGGVSCTHGASNVAGPTKAGSCNVFRYGSTSVLGSSGRSSSQTRAAVMTGRYPFRNGMTSNPAPDGGPAADLLALDPSAPSDEAMGQIVAAATRLGVTLPAEMTA